MVILKAEITRSYSLTNNYSYISIPIEVGNVTASVFFSTLTWKNKYFSKLKFWNAIREFEIFMFKSTKRKPEGRRKNIFPSSFWSNKKTLVMDDMTFSD